MPSKPKPTAEGRIGEQPPLADKEPHPYNKPAPEPVINKLVRPPGEKRAGVPDSAKLPKSPTRHKKSGGASKSSGSKSKSKSKSKSSEPKPATNADLKNLERRFDLLVAELGASLNNMFSAQVRGDA